MTTVTPKQQIIVGAILIGIGKVLEVYTSHNVPLGLFGGGLTLLGLIVALRGIFLVLARR